MFNKIVDQLYTVISILLEITNWWWPFLYKFGLYRGTKLIRFFDGDTLNISEQEACTIPSLARLKRSCRVSLLDIAPFVRVSFPNGITFDLNRSSFFWELNVLNEIWVWDEYLVRNRNLAGQTVVDVGGFIGDSALFFASLGATVHVFEPFSHAVESIRRNLQLSGEIGKRVHVHPVALNCRAEQKVIRFNRNKAFAQTDMPTADNVAGESEEVITFVESGDYFRKLGLFDVAILKVDCEGCEYDLLCNSTLIKALQPKEISLEYHSGPANLLKTLSTAGYRVLNTPRKSKLGLLFAKRVDVT